MLASVLALVLDEEATFGEVFLCVETLKYRFFCDKEGKPFFFFFFCDKGRKRESERRSVVEQLTIGSSPCGAVMGGGDVMRKGITRCTPFAFIK